MREGVEDREHLREQAVLVLDGLRPGRDRVGDLHHQRRRPLDATRRRRAARPARRAVLLGLAHVVEEQVHGRRRELPGPFAGRRVERDLDALEAVALELALEHAAQRLVEVGEHRVERHLDGQHAPTLNRFDGVAAKNRAYFRAEQRVGSPPTMSRSHDLRRGPLLELPLRADAPRPAGDRRGAARALDARPGDGARARDRLRRRRQPDRDGGRPRRGSRALGIDLAAEPIAEGQRDHRGGRHRERRAAPGRHLRPARRAARRLRLRHRPRRLRVDPRAGARRPAGDDPQPPRGRRARATSPTTPTPAATCAGRCATPGCWYAGGRARPRVERAERAQRALPVRVGEPRRHQRLVGRRCWRASSRPFAEGPIYRLVHDDLGEHWAPVWFARLRRARGGQRTRLRRRRRPHQPAAGPGARRRSRATPEAISERRPDRAASS